ncbi:MAG: hypothetical protein WBE76_17210 [Terracidiphilus sp.]
MIWIVGEEKPKQKNIFAFNSTELIEIVREISVFPCNATEAASGRIGTGAHRFSAGSHLPVLSFVVASEAKAITKEET